MPKGATCHRRHERSSHDAVLEQSDVAEVAPNLRPLKRRVAPMAAVIAPPSVS